MSLKQIQKNLSKYGLFALILLILAQIFYVGVIVFPKAQAVERRCTYDDVTRNLRPIKATALNIRSTPDNQELVRAVNGTYSVTFVSGDSFSLTDCQGQVNVSIGIFAHFSLPPPRGSTSQISVDDQIQSAITSSTVSGGELTISGTFNIPDLTPAIIEGERSEILTRYTAGRTYPSFLRIKTSENGVNFSFDGASNSDPTQDDLNLYGCYDQGQVCAKHSTGGSTNTTGGNSDEIRLNDIKFKLSTALTGEGLRFSPAERKDREIHNFVRLYVEDQDGKPNDTPGVPNGAIVGFPMHSNIFLSAPTDKTLGINNNGQTSKIFLSADPNSTIVKKDAVFVGTGITDPKQVYKTTRDYGCIVGETTTHYVLDNKPHAFNLCNYAVNAKSESVALRAGGDGFDFTLTVNDAVLQKLRAINPVTCTDKNAGTGCDDKVNIVDVSAVLGLDEITGADQSYLGPALLTMLGGPVGAGFSLWNAWSALKQQWNYLDGLPISSNTQNKFYIQIYPTKAAWEKNLDSAIPSSVPEPQEVETSVGAADQATGLFAFLVRVMNYIVIILTTVIYGIFSYILVPVLNALLRVRPYQDAFVDVIYPGWIILRNLANIVFIVALLVMGLRILFQFDDSGKSRGFIVTLILMALLVNFSLVIAQGIVAIADTIQSQFLPANSNVIEALGVKLMAEPILQFQAAGVNVNAGTAANEVVTADLFKPIMLLITSIAALFSFAALAAFIAVRTVALWVFYLTAPFAYFGRVLPQTKAMADRWWTEFIKYVIMVPVLVFFLNIAALIATTFASKTGNVINITGAGVTGNIAGWTLTVISQAIVLLFLFAGMKFALSSGTIGSKAIVDYAKKGFTSTFKGAKNLGYWAKDAAGDAASEAARKAGWHKGAAAISALTQPAITSKALKEKFWTEPKKKQMERLAKKRDSLEKFASNVGNNKIQAAKMLGWKLRGKGAGHFRNEADELRSILTDNERQDRETGIINKQADLAATQQTIGNTRNTQVRRDQAQNYKDSLEKQIKDIESERDEKIGDLSRAKVQAQAAGRQDEADRLQGLIDQSAQDYQNRLNPHQQNLQDIDNRLTGQQGNILNMGGNADANRVLQINADNVQADINKMRGELDNDLETRTKHGFAGPIDEARKSAIIAQAKEMESLAAKREFPHGPGDVAARLAKEKEEEKLYEGVDDPETLRVAFEDALKKNNLEAATAIAKKIAKEGNFKDLLEAHGYKNNLEDFQKFMKVKFNRAPVTVVNQISSEVSYLNGQNGNRALAHATNVDTNRVVRFNTRQQQGKLLEKTAGKKPLWERKKGDIAYEDSTGAHFNAGEFDNLNKLTPQKLLEIRKRVNPDVAQYIIDKIPEAQNLRQDVKDTLEDIKLGR